MRSKRNWGTTLLEFLLASVIFIFIAMVSAALVYEGGLSWRSVESRWGVQIEMGRSMYNIATTLRLANISTVVLGNNNHAILFQSPTDKDDQNIIIDALGHPVAQRFVLFYLVNQDGSSNVDSQDNPYRMFCRKDIALSAAPVNINNYINVNANQANVLRFSILGENILYFNVNINPGEPVIGITLKAVRLLEASKFGGLSGDLSSSRFTIQMDNKVVPMN